MTWTWGWTLVVVHLVLSVPMWRLLTPSAPDPIERMAPWLIPEQRLRRDRRIAIVNIAWGVLGLALFALALLGVW